jgi:formiminotetrahydrofolate cyclodeaminase
MLRSKSIEEYLEQTAAKEPLLPAGGSSVALCAALAAALIEFTANTTIGNPEYEEAADSMKYVTDACKIYRNLFTWAMDEDAETYSSLIAARKLPQDTEEQIIYRKEAISDKAKQATMIPLKLAEKTLAMLDLIQVVLENGNRKAAGDAVAASYLAKAVIHSSLNNVKINLTLLDDPEFSKDVVTRLQEVENKLEMEE